MSQSEFRPLPIAGIVSGDNADLGLRAKLAGITGWFSPWFWFIVIVPTILAALYFFVIASDLYMSEARFIVRSENQQTPTVLGTILQSTGMQTTTNDASTAESFITSREAALQLEHNQDLREAFSRPEGDFVTRFPGLFSGSSFEMLYRHYLRYVDVSLDSQTGVTTLRVKAYRPQDAQLIAQALLAGSERLVNQLNARAETDAVQFARREVDAAERQLELTQKNITKYRLQAQLLDPKLSSGTIYATLGGLMTARANVATQLAELTKDSPGNPSIPSLKTRLGALNSQVDLAVQNATGGSNSVAGQLGEYERLSLEEDMSAKMLTSATEALETARLQAQSKHLYIEHIAEPSLPDYAIYPERLFDFCVAFVSSLVVYGIFWLLLASVREHGAA